MSDDQIKKYVKAQLESGISKDKVIESMKKSGYSDAQIEDVFLNLEQKSSKKWIYLVVGIIIIGAIIFGITNKQQKIIAPMEIETIPQNDDYWALEQGANLNDMAYCNRIISTEVRQSCISVIENDLKKCKGVTDQMARIVCLVQLGEKQNNHQLCEEDKSDFVKYQCRTYFSNFIEPNITMDPKKYECIRDKRWILGECLAYSKKDINYCDDITVPFGKSICKVKLSKNISTCDNINVNEQGYDTKVDCILYSAKTEDDCNKIKVTLFNKDEINECIALVNKDITKCENLKAESKYSCMAQITLNATYCEMIPDFVRSWMCKAQVGTDPEICETYHVEFCKHFFDVNIKE